MMGVPGRDLIIWLLLTCLVASIAAVVLNLYVAGQVLFLFEVILAGAWFKYTLYDAPKAREQSRKMGLEAIDLLPLNTGWAKWLTGRKFSGDVVRAYEIHLHSQNNDPRWLIKAMERDLVFIEQNMQGLFLWQTNIAVPRRVSKIIKEYEREEKAFWESGRWIVPSPPLTGNRNVKKSKKVLRRGAIVIGGGCKIE